jgi:hypothetical protein
VRLDPADGSESVVASLGLTDPSSFTATPDGRTVYAASFFTDWRSSDGEEAVSWMRREVRRLHEFARDRMTRYDAAGCQLVSHFERGQGLAAQPDQQHGAHVGMEGEFFQHPMGAVIVADTEEICDRALRLLKIEWEERPFILDMEEALKPDAPKIMPEVKLMNPKAKEPNTVLTDRASSAMSKRALSGDLR